MRNKLPLLLALCLAAACDDSSTCTNCEKPDAKLPQDAKTIDQHLAEDIAPIVDLSPDSSPDSCVASCVERQCGPDSCGSTCQPGCTPEACGVGESFLAQHQTALETALAAGAWKVEVPPLIFSIMQMDLEFCSNGGCYLAFDISPGTFSHSIGDISATLAVTFWSADAQRAAHSWPYIVKTSSIIEIECLADIDSRTSPPTSQTFQTQVSLELDLSSGAAQVDFDRELVTSSLDDYDFVVNGGILCDQSDLLQGVLMDYLLNELKQIWRDTVSQQSCAPCTDITDCASGKSCDKVCWQDDFCAALPLIPLCVTP